MQKIGLTLFSILMTFHLWANEKKIEIQTNINKVIVFSNGAEISHQGNFNISEGKSYLLIINISTKIHKKSIQASLSNDIRILSIKTDIDELTPHQNAQKVEKLNDSLIFITNQLTLLTTEIADIQEERSMILENKTRLGKEGGFSIAELQAASLFFQKRLKEISREKFTIQQKIADLTKIKNNISKQLTTDVNLKENPKNYILILVDSKKNQQATLELSYAVLSAGWDPKYNIRAESVEKPIQFEYLANVYNNTGVDWKDVDLTLSTGDPFKSLTLPSLKSVWSLDYNYNYLSEEEGYLNKQRASSNTSIHKQDKLINKNNSYTADVEISAVTVDFKIKEKHSITSNNQAFLIEVNTYELPTSYQYYAIPKIECQAFLMANVTNWENVNIIDSYANIYYGGKYVGESYINTEIASDTLSFSMGRDAKINITRVKKVAGNKQKWIGMYRTNYFEYEIAIRNMYNTPIKIEIVDQIPVAQQSDIEVDITTISNAVHVIENGRLTWDLSIDPKVTKKLQTSFSVKYPKHKKLKVPPPLRTPRYRHDN